jgi:hypothetical protein
MSESNQKSERKKSAPKIVAEKNEEAMIGGIIEGSPDSIGVAVVRLACGCRKMAAINKEGEAASKVIMYRDSASSICDLCKEDNGAFSRVTEQFIHWDGEPPTEAEQKRIEAKIFGTYGNA